MSQRRVVSVGDLHGDLQQAKLVFEMAGLLDGAGNWAGGNDTIFVQTGDVVDRMPDTIALFELMERMKQQAFEAGGEVIALLGNHEVMNMMRDYRFLHDEDIATFQSMEQRLHAFSVTGSIGRHLYSQNLVQRVGDTIFCHAGISEHWASLTVREINEKMHADLPRMVHSLASKAKKYAQFPIFGMGGPVWFRDFSRKPESKVCDQLQRVLEMMGARRMVVGHSLQRSGKVLVRCDGRYLVADVGISRGFVTGGMAAAVEIWNGVVKVLYPDRAEVVRQGSLD